MDEVIIFNPLDPPEVLQKIVDIALKQLEAQRLDNGLQRCVSPAVRSHLATLSFPPE